MAANMTRMTQVVGMSTRESLNRPRQGVSRWQGEHCQDMRLNGQESTLGRDGGATQITARMPRVTGAAKGTERFQQERVYGKDSDVKYLILQSRAEDPSWTPSKWARK